ncbi:GNAT family N-acetyltransferase [Halobellus rufus]|uniref:GNAT family N-acetyltransferase n=1 Tax=Halobellus rufus TaxID=1448860 RepID=UPI000678BF01|nr:GNAT family N-acetyltransferase [Halobellus rufus]
MRGSQDGPGSAEEPSVTVRPADRADLLDVLRIERDAFSEPWPYAAFESVLDAPAFLVAVGEVEQRSASEEASGEKRAASREGVDGPQALLGYVVGDVMPNHGRDIGHIKDLAVRSDARGRGIGRRLLREALFGLALAGAAVAKLEVREGNEAARSLYREEGFEPTRRVPRYYGDGEDALILVVDVDSWYSTA